jgi:hypothetical protein
VTRPARRQWTPPERRRLENPNDRSLRFGYVLRGALELLDGDDNASCLSSVSNIHLKVTYEVLSD